MRIGWTLLVLMLLAGCSRLTLLRPDTSRGDFESTAHKVVLEDTGRRGASGALAHVQLAQHSFASGDVARAEKEARTALKLDPRSASAFAVLALVQDRSGNAKAAGEHYRRAAELAPAQGGMLNNYGTWLCSQGRAAESLLWFEQALAAPRYATPAIAAGNAGACALQAGQTARADELLKQAITLDPENQVALGAKAELEFKAGHAMAARAFSQRRLAAAPADAAALLLASRIEYKLGDSAAAEAYVSRLKAQFPDAPQLTTGEDSRQ